MSLRRRLLSLALAAAVFAVAAPTLASGVSSTADTKASGHGTAPSGDAKKSKGEHGEKADETKKGEAKDDGGLFSSQDNLVPLPTIIAPVLIGDRLTAHLYLYLAALTPTAAEAQEVKMRLPYIQDAMVRDVYRSALMIADPEQAPDTTALLARMKEVVNRAVGKPLVTEIEVGRIDMAPY